MIKAKRTRNAESDYDSHWKKLIEEDFEDFMAFSYAKLHEAIDYTKTVEFLPQTLHKILADYGKKGTKTTDLLIKVFLKPAYTASGKSEEVWLLIHIEIEISPAGNFSFRMFSYFYRALDKYGKKVVALAVFPGEKPQPHHKYFEWERFGTKIRYDFNHLDAHAWTEEELLKEKSIIALALLASKRTVKTRTKQSMRYRYKRELLKLIKERNYPIKKATRLLTFVFYIMYLPKDLDVKITKDVFNQKENDMSRTKLSPQTIEQSETLRDALFEIMSGIPYDDFIEEQNRIKQQINLYRIQIRQDKQERLLLEQKAADEKQKAEQEKLLLEQKVAEEKQKAQQEKLLLEQKAAEEKQKAAEEKQKVEQEKLLLEQKVAEEKQKVEQEKLLLKQKVEQEKLLLKQKVEQEKLLLKQKAIKEQKSTIYQLSKLLSTNHIATVMKMTEEEVIAIIEAYEQK